MRAADLPGRLTVTGEIRAGEKFAGEVHSGQAIEIMTGAPLPAGADAVVMIEHTTRSGDCITIDRTLAGGQNVNPLGSEAQQGQILLNPGARLGFAEIALLATAGQRRVRVYQRPRVAILATGDELVGIEEHPAAYQIRNSNSYSLAVQVKRAGGSSYILGVAKDDRESTARLLDRGLTFDLLLISGGVSAGKYDLVEQVLTEFEAEFFFDRVRIQPGQPLVFGTALGKFFFGLPGNPVSTMVTFEVFARAALDLLSGQTETLLPLLWSRLSSDFRQKTGLKRFLPARLTADGSSVAPVRWQGSGDVSALARANAFLVTEPQRETWSAGDLIQVLQK